jgi:hypothetical protein
MSVNPIEQNSHQLNAIGLKAVSPLMLHHPVKVEEQQKLRLHVSILLHRPIVYEKELIQSLTFAIEWAKTRCFVNDASGAYGVLKEAMDLIPVEPLDLTQEEPAPDRPEEK